MDAVEPRFLTARPSHELRPRPSTKRRNLPPPKTPITPHGATTKDARLERISPSSGLQDGKDSSPPKPISKLARQPSSKLTRKPSSAGRGRPLLPLTERKSYEERAVSRGRREGKTERLDVAPDDNASAARKGRQFTVVNVGNNGRLYLRPSVRRAANPRYPQPNFTFPVTPPGTAGPDASNSERPKLAANVIQHHESQYTPTPRTSTALGSPNFTDLKPPPRPTKHRRAMSDSTINELNPSKEPTTIGYRVVISKPGPCDGNRPRTMDNLNPSAPVLNINIPSWRIGTPRFTLRGTPVIRGSSCAATEDLTSSSASFLNQSNRNFNGKDFGSSNRSSHLVIPQVRFPGTSSQPASPCSLRPMRSTYLSTQVVIEPAMFTDLTFQPACDDRSIVRYSPAGAVTAATAPRLVAEITSPSFLDYELLSDFFLTFRSFLEPESLLRMLVARLRWALGRQDEAGMIVRVRTFVAVRHWILNYFMDDFVLAYGLRVTFCTLLNDFVDELSQDAKARKVQLKILGELKKCWRRVCAHYWDGPDFDDSLGVEVPIAPGGIAGNRDPNLDSNFWEREGVQPPHLENLSPIPSNSTETASLRGGAPRTTDMGDFIVLGNRPGTPDDHLATSTGPRNGAISPLSIASMDIVSCSFPSKAMKLLNPNSIQPLGAHPVYLTSPIPQSAAIATTPRALAGKRVRPQQSHKRNNSITDSLREHSSDKSSGNDAEFSMTLQSAGSLVRGNLLPPGQPFVDIEPEDDPSDANRQTTIFQPPSRNLAKEKLLGGAMSGSGMKKLLGSVRRALSSRGQPSNGSETNLTNISPVGSRSGATNRLPGTAVVPQGFARLNGARPPMRIDLLGAEVVEDFRKAIREEEAAAEAERLSVSIPVPNLSDPGPAIPGPSEYSAAHMESTTFHSLPQNQRPRPVSDMGITTGSKSIVIVDDTVPFDVSRLHAGMPAFSPSVEALADSFMPTGGDPTPPTTPPAPTIGGTPRRSSYLINQHLIPPAGPHDPLPPFIPDLATLGGTQGSRPSEDLSRPSFSTMCRSQRYFPGRSEEAPRMHRRNISSKTHQSVSSVRRRASYSSEVVPPSTVLSFDATTDSSVLDKPDIPPPEPPRVIRRRPGGDLRAVKNVGELDGPAVKKSRSVGSLTGHTESIPSSYLLSTSAEPDGHLSPPDPDDHPAERQFSVGQLTEKPVKRDLSLFSTHSSKPMMRPSFEKEARKLAQIPDDDDGGVESALLKLEGKYQPKKKKKPLPIRRRPSIEDLVEVVDITVNVAVYDTETQNQMETEDQHPQPHGKLSVPSADGDRRGSVSHVRGDRLDVANDFVNEPRSFLLSEASRDSYCSIPLLDRGLTDGCRSKRPTPEWTDRSIFRASDDDDASDEIERILRTIPATEPQHLSYDFVEKTNSIEKIRPGQTAPSAIGDQTFLDDDSVVGSDLSSELSVIDATSSGNLDGHGELFPISAQLSHPFGDPVSLTRSGSAPGPVPLTQETDIVPERELYEDQIWVHKPLPLTPDITTTAPYIHEPKSSYEPPGTGGSLRSDPHPKTGNCRKYSVHLPFTLAFDSDILAQQFTLIEKDALNDIDWKELIEMNWKNATSNDSRSWVDFLKNTDAHGVEVVVARFNIMVKWAISEIVLTQHIEERARCIIKFIHIAAHCRRYRNFATLAQLTIALSSNEVSRLVRTWELVPAHDLKTLSELETLVTPTRNFYNLRAEMESGSDSGCIPFVGIYTHDLLYNAQRPSEIASSPTTSPLINFERCRIGAAVVKTLLRLLEASTRYAFQPIEGITERCLWMSALSDEEIRRHSETLE